MAQIRKTIDSLLDNLNPRQKEVIAGRFGLQNQEPQTLAAIGEKYKLTRERIRQIENASLGILKTKITQNPECQGILQKGKKYLQASGGLVKEDILLSQLNSVADGLNRNHLNFLIETSGEFFFHGEDKEFWPFYFLNKETMGEAVKFINQFSKFLKPKRELALAGKFDELFSEFKDSEKTKEAYAKNYLGVSKKVHTNPFGDTGLAEWPEIKPANIRDRIYLVLKKSNEPLHFETITQKINETSFNRKVALSPTVHNELIKDKRFVLVGRGIYGLAERGYRPGTVQEVIRRILKENGPMKTKDISLALSRERIIKPNTILVNLQNRRFFERLENGAYRIRED